jgi:heptosyltransferase-1
MRRILFVKTSSLGDVVQHCPAVSDARRERPGASIDWVVEEPFAEIASMHAGVRRVIPVAMRRWRRSLWRPSVWAEIARFRRSLRAERYDAVIDTQGLLKSALICAGTSGRKHGLDRASAREPVAARFYDVAHAVPKALHAVERNRLLTAKALGYSLKGPAQYGLRAPAKASGPAGDSPTQDSYAVFLTMTSRDDKLWPQARWVELGRALNIPIFIPWGGPAEKARAESIAAEMGNATVCPRMSLGEISVFIEKAVCVVGLDTGLTHLAAALGVLTVGIYCASDPALTGLHGSPSARNVGEAGRPPGVAEVLKALD